jgi:hypothetical protein
MHASAKREVEGSHARGKKLDFELPIHDGRRLADQLVPFSVALDTV